MKNLVYSIFIMLLLTACSEGKLTDAELTPPLPDEYQEIGKKVLTSPESGSYVYDGQYHPTNYGYILEISGNEYKKAKWSNSSAYIEHGIVTAKEYIYVDHINKIYSYSYVIEFEPTYASPNNCINALNQYSNQYDWRGSTATTTDYVGLDSANINASTDIFYKSIGAKTVDAVSNALAAACQ